MWRPSVSLAAFLVLLGALLVLLIAAGVSSASSSAPAASSCPFGAATGLGAAVCPVPTGGTVDPCFITGGLVHCAITLPDLNPAHWLNWLGCAVIADAALIFNAISGYIGNFLISIFNGLSNAVLTPLNQLLGVLEGAITATVSWFGTVISGLFQLVTGWASVAGPFAPILVVGITLLVFLLGGIGLYLAVVLLFGLGKTLFNLA